MEIVGEGRAADEEEEEEEEEDEGRKVSLMSWKAGETPVPPTTCTDQTRQPLFPTKQGNGK